MGIQIVKERTPKRKIKPYYELVFDYMIGDANGNTTEIIKVSPDNLYLEKYVRLLNKLKPTKGTWGLILDSETIYKCFKEKQISEEDYYFLMKIMFDNDDDDHDYELPNNDDYIYELQEGVRSNTEYSFLVFQGVDLIYIDENRKRHKTKFVK